MKKDEYDKRMRALEYFHKHLLLPGAWIIIRVDGRSFSRFTEDHFEKPFDSRFSDLMMQTTKTLLTELSGLLAYTASDEISVLCSPEWNIFDRSLEKIVSISAAIASATFTHASNMPVSFDSRVWLGTNGEQIRDYFRWRQAHASRCALNGWCYWTLRKDGKSPVEATALIEGKSVAFKNELLFQHGVNYNDLPLWQRRGIVACWESYMKTGYDPIRQCEVTAQRRRIAINDKLPMKDDFSALIEGIIADTQGEKDHALRSESRGGA
jgi:tRNA(His) guanylyltransferase